MELEFATYLRLGFSHIADLRGYDHIAFIVALTAGFAPRDWRRLLWLVTAFTMGHSLTLALATLNVVRVRGSLTEALIAGTIVMAGARGVVAHRHRAVGEAVERRQDLLYAMAGAFGLIHGLGFSSYLRSLLGGEEHIVLPLFAFNVGLEVGQLLIVGGVLLVGTTVCAGLGVSRQRWALGLSVIAVLVGLRMLAERA